MPPRAAEWRAIMGDIIFEPMNFVNNLQYMGIGMLGVLMIVGIIMFSTYIIGAVTGNSQKKD